MKTITIHQPEHLPWSGFFHKMAQADEYVFLDNVQFKKNNWQNRNRIVDSAGNYQWLTVPVLLKGHTRSTIADTMINNNTPWKRKYVGRIFASYSKHLFFKEFIGEISAIIETEFSKLIDLNIELIRFFCTVLEVGTPAVFASNFNITGSSSELLVNICKNRDSNRYISGPDGATYLDLALFADAGIEVVFHEFKPPVYESRNYLPALSVLDVLFNYGYDSRRVVGLG